MKGKQLFIHMLLNNNKILCRHHCKVYEQNRTNTQNPPPRAHHQPAQTNTHNSQPGTTEPLETNGSGQ
jgi:hypothetical protein